MARTVEPSKTIRRKSTSEASGGGARASAELAPFDADFTHGLFDAPLKAWLHSLRFIEELQQMQAQSLHGTDSPLGPIIVETDGSRGLEDLFGLPVSLAAEQAAIMARLSSECLGDLLEVQRQWLEQAESVTAKTARAWLSKQGQLTAPSARAALELPLGASPIGLFNNTQAALAEMARIWVDAVEHDVHHA